MVDNMTPINSLFYKQITDMLHNKSRDGFYVTSPKPRVTEHFEGHRMLSSSAIVPLLIAVSVDAALVPADKACVLK